MIVDEIVFKQIHAYAMGSPVSPVVANLCMEAIEEMAINTTPVPPKVMKYWNDMLATVSASLKKRSWLFPQHRRN